MRPGNADMKYPWELSRSQHWITLAQAWQLTRESRFAREIANELDDFIEANPVGIGINWTCTMDVAIRAANWCLALCARCTIVRDSMTDTWRRAYEALFDHAEFIFCQPGKQLRGHQQPLPQQRCRPARARSEFVDIGERDRLGCLVPRGAGDRDRRPGARGGDGFRSRRSPITGW